MKYVYTALLAIVFLTACVNEPATPSAIHLPKDPEKLKALLSEDHDDRTRIAICYELYKSYRDTEEDIAIQYLNKQLELAHEIQDFLVAGKACYNIGLLQLKKGDYINAIDAYIESVKNFEEIHDSTRIALVLNNIGVVFMETGNFEYATKFFLKAKKHYEVVKDLEHLVLVNVNLGLCSFSKSEPDYDNASKYFSEGEAITNELSEDRDYYLNWILNAKGAMMYKMKKYEDAKKYYLGSLEHLDPSKNLIETKFIAYSNIGEAVIGTSNYKAASEWIEKALELLKAGDVDRNFVLSAKNIEAELYQKQGKETEAVEVLESAIKEADTEVINPTLKESLKILSKSYRRLNQTGKPVNASRYDNILILFEKQEALEKDLVEKTNFKALQAALGLKIELENEKQEKKAIIQTKSIYFNSIIGAIAIAFLIAIGLGYRVKKAKQDHKEFETKVKYDMSHCVYVVENWDNLPEHEKKISISDRSS